MFPLSPIKFLIQKADSRFSIFSHFNPFVPNGPFLYHMKTLENRKKKGWRKGALGINGLILYVPRVN